MAITIEEMAVKFTVDGEQVLYNSFNNVAKASEASSAKVSASLGHMGTVSEQTGRKIENVADKLVNVLTNLSVGGDAPIKKLTNTVEALGMTFGTTVGLVVVAAAQIGERIVDVFMKAREEAKKAREEFEKELGAMANAGESSKLQEKLREITYGTPFDEKGQLRKRSEAFRGAFEGSLADLEARFAKLNAELPRGATMASGKTAEEYNKVVRALDVMREKAAETRRAIENLASQPAEMSGLLPTRVTAQSDDAKRLTIDSAFVKQTIDYTGAFADTRRIVLEQLMVRLGKMQAGMAEDFAKMREEAREALIKPKVVPVNTGGVMSERMQQLQTEMLENAKRIIALAESIATRAASVLAGGIEAGLRSAFSGGGVKGAFKALLGSLLEGMGDMFEQIGISALLGLGLLAKIKAAILAFAPEIGIPLAIALIALGAGMKAGGSALGNSGGGGGGGAGGGSLGGLYGGSVGPVVVGVNPVTPITPGSVSSSASSNLKPLKGDTYNVTFFGKDDPKVQREFLELQARANRRGSTAG